MLKIRYIICLLCFFTITHNGYARDYHIKLTTQVNYIFSSFDGAKITLGKCGSGPSKILPLIRGKLDYELTADSCHQKSKNGAEIDFLFRMKGQDYTHKCFLVPDSKSRINVAHQGVKNDEQFKNCFSNTTTHVDGKLERNLPPSTNILSFYIESMNKSGAENVNNNSTLVKNYAPTVNLCNMNEVYQKYKINTTDTMPMSVEQYLNISNLVNKEHQLITGPSGHFIIGDVVLENSDLNSEFLHRIDQLGIDTTGYFIKTDMSESLSGPQNPSETPIYAHVKRWKTNEGRDLGFIDVQYHMFYALNNSQYFRSGRGEPNSYTRNWQMDNFARHWGDWEHITVRLDSESKKIIGVFFSAHGDGYWTKPKFEMGTHPVIYSACNSHANYDTPRIETLEDNFYEADKIGCQIWLKAVDNAELSNIPWRPWQSDKVIDVDVIQNNETVDPKLPALNNWLKYKGAWGKPKRPVDFQGTNGDAHGKGSCITSIVSFALEPGSKPSLDPSNPRPLLSDKYTYEPGGPTGPWTKDNIWYGLQ